MRFKRNKSKLPSLGFAFAGILIFSLFTGLLIFFQEFISDNLQNLPLPEIIKTEIIKPLPRQDPFAQAKLLLEQQNISLDQVPVASGSAIFFRLSDGSTNIFLANNDDLQMQISSLQIILNKLTIEGRKARSIDLRYGDPVIVYQ